LLEDLLDWFLSERQIYLLKNENDKGNGLKLGTPMGNLEISVPRTQGWMNPLVINGYSESSLLNTLKSLNLPYSDDELNKIKDDLKSELDLFKQRELPESVFALLIDAYHCEIKDGSKVRKAA